VPLVAQPAHSDLYHVIFHGGRPVELRTERGRPNLKLSIVLHCRPAPHPLVAETFIVGSTYYAYEILDLDEAEILVYHWHPAGPSAVSEPHLHLSPKIGPIDVASRGQSPGQVRLAGMHILTGRVLVEQVVRLLITEFGVAPLTNAWEDILVESAEMFRAD
jgi:hypothetical protein